MTRASSPGASPVTRTGSVRAPRGRICAGAFTSTVNVRAARSISNQVTPSERPGMRRAAWSSGRCTMPTR